MSRNSDRDRNRTYKPFGVGLQPTEPTALLNSASKYKTTILNGRVNVNTSYIFLILVREEQTIPGM